MKKTVIALLIVGCAGGVWGDNLVKDAAKTRQQVNEASAKTAASQEKLKAVKKAAQTQKNVVRSKELILAGKDPAVVAKDAAANKGAEVVLWDFKLAERKEFFRDNGLPQGVTYEADVDRNVLRFTSTEKSSLAVRYFSPEELEKTRGKKIKLTVMVKGKDIAGKGAAKFMLMVHRKNNPTMWPDAQLGKGSFDWKKATFTYNVPFDLKSCAMILGLQGMTGTIWFKDLKIVVVE